MKPLLRIPPAKGTPTPVFSGPPRVVVRVEMLNDDGDRAACIASGKEIDDAVAAAEHAAHVFTRDESWTMTEWEAVR